SRVARETMTRAHAGSGSLLDLYPKTIDAYLLVNGAARRLDALAEAFLESDAFDAYRESPHSGPGCSLEEAFYRFAEAESIGEAAVREREFLAATARLYCVSPRAACTLPNEFRRSPGGYYAVSARGDPTLFAAVRGRFVSGRLTPFLAELVSPGA